MKLEILCRRSADSKAFIEHWSKLYTYPNASLYDDNIGKPLNETRVLNLFRWKNGYSKISEKKLKSIEIIYLPQIGKAPNLRTIEEGREYLKRLGRVGIWGIFWLHCLNPMLFPIFDQHTYRAMANITEQGPKEIPGSRSKTLAIYFDKYLKFLASFGETDWRSLDMALFSYGRFLKSEFSAE